MPTKDDYTQRADGDWSKFARRGTMFSMFIACCDCGLVHRFNVRIRGGRAEMQAFRRNRMTASRRKTKDLKFRRVE